MSQLIDQRLSITFHIKLCHLIMDLITTTSSKLFQFQSLSQRTNFILVYCSTEKQLHGSNNSLVYVWIIIALLLCLADQPIDMCAPEHLVHLIFKNMFLYHVNLTSNIEHSFYHHLCLLNWMNSSCGKKLVLTNFVKILSFQGPLTCEWFFWDYFHE